MGYYEVKQLLILIRLGVAPEFRKGEQSML